MKTEKKLVVGIGEILWDIFDDRKTLGGAPANFAYHASKAGARGVVVSAIGNDALGNEIESRLREKNLNALLQHGNRATGTVRVSLDGNGVARYVFPPDVAWDYLEFSDEFQALAQSANAVAFGTLAQRNSRSRASIRAFLNRMTQGSLRVFDINLRQNFYSEALIRESLEYTNILKLNDDELSVLAPFFGLNSEGDFSALSEAFFQKIFAEFPGLSRAVLTCGANGSLAGTREGERSRIVGNPDTRVVDTVGAGDAFTATFTVAILDGKPLHEAHKLAAERAALVCSRPGAMPE